MVESFLFESGAPGPKLLIFGAIHGDEDCGPVAIRGVMDEITSGKLKLRSGSVRFVPVCNPQAHAAKQRVLKENLNRVFHKTENPESAEGKIANELCALVDECDVLLDIHSSFVPAPSNVFVDYPTKENLAFARALNPEFLIFDWPRVYENNEFAFDSWTTDRYAHEAGKIGVLVECGKHDDPIARTRARAYILRTLEHFMVADHQEPEGPTHRPQGVSMTTIFQRDSAEDVFTKPWYHLEFMKAGTEIARRKAGGSIVANEDCYIIFPKEYALPGGEWFYLAVPVERA